MGNSYAEAKGRVQDQTNEDWLRGPPKGAPVPVTPRTIEPLPSQVASDTYRLISYLTFKDQKGGGRLVMEFKNAKTSNRVKAFFNVNIKGQRGKNKDKYFSIGKKCRFWPDDNSKFMKFWEKAIGSDGSSSTIYKRMGKLKEISFTGKFVTKQDYIELQEVHIL